MSIRARFGLMASQATCLFSRATCWFFAGALLLSGPAAAATIKNNDQQTYKIEIIGDDARSQQELVAGKALSEFCKTGCVIRLNGSPDKDYALEGSERVSIEGGLVYYDGEVVRPKGDASEAQAQ